MSAMACDHVAGPAAMRFPNACTRAQAGTSLRAASRSLWHRCPGRRPPERVMRRRPQSSLTADALLQYRVHHPCGCGVRREPLGESSRPLHFEARPAVKPAANPAA